MHKQTFDEKQLEKLLQDMPKVKDLQDPEQLFAKISSRLEEEKTIEKKIENKNSARKKRTWILPTLASIAAVVIVALVVPSLLYQQDSTMENKSARQSVEEKATESVEQGVKKNFTMMAEDDAILKSVADSQSHVIPAVANDQDIVTVAIPDANAQFVVPVSFIVPKDGATSRLERIETIKDHLREAEWGLSSYILEGVKLSEEQLKNGSNKLIINVPAAHQYGNGSAMEVIFLSTVKEMAKQLGYQMIEFQTEGKPGITLGNYGELQKLDLQKEKAKGAYYVFQPNGQVQKYLVPFPQEADFNKVLTAMKAPVEIDLQQIKPSIPEDVNFQKVTVDNNNKKAVIEFTDDTAIANEESDLLMIEAILMTAKEYDIQTVEFLNAKIDMVGPYNLQEPVQVPLAVNPMPY